MKIILASSMGFCFGVQRAVDLATKLSKEEIKAATFGPLIHNPQLVEKLKQQGINCKNTLHEFQTNEKVIIRSHGVGPEIYQQIESLSLSYADATCPFVKKAQIAAQNFANNDYLPIIIGEKEHPEVKSIKAWGGATAFVVESEADFSQIPFVKKYGVVAQTTFNKDRFKDLLQKIQTAKPGNYEVNLTICSATESRQTAALELASISDAIIVIGGKNSANTKHLVELVSQVCSRVYHIETAEEITKNMLHNITTVGVTAGASTPDWLIKEAVNKMESMESMESLLEEMNVSVHPGASVKGTIVAITRDEVIIDFGYQSEGRIAFDQWSKDADKSLIEAN
ncbi:MAG TPA: 4-hydroxy-3-methylbut-2-enyl diphosphate reductase, partial [Candidatus Avacidaminococcus intestinavium]|nr:4-hydroxy-3-methylbut-2-enyl diphosphate reductase [Candidatus Avacidaminococcus intestinavium]